MRCGIPDTLSGTLRGGILSQRDVTRRDILDDLAENLSMAVPESKWTELIIYLIEAMERKAKDRAEFDSLMYGMLEYISKRVG